MKKKKKTNKISSQIFLHFFARRKIHTEEYPQFYTLAVFQTIRKIRAEESSFPNDDEIANRQDKETVSTRLTHLITTDPVSWHRVDALAAGGMLVPRCRDPAEAGIGANRRQRKCPPVE